VLSLWSEDESGIAAAPDHGVLVKGGMIYTTLGETALNLLREAGVKVRKVPLSGPRSSEPTSPGLYLVWKCWS
jgi:hypothetical protein